MKKDNILLQKEDFRICGERKIMKITMETRLEELLELSELKEREYMLNPFMGDILKEALGDQYDEIIKGKSYAEFTLEEMKSFIPAWTISSIKQGWEYLAEKAQKQRLIYDFWSEEAKKEDPSKEKTGLMAFVVPGCRKFVMVCPGGGYTNVCSISEGFPIARQINELGYSAFVLQYRTNEAAGYPNPMDDLAESLRYVFAHAEEFGVDVEDYAVAGFSAGGHLAASFGTESLGYKKYGLPKPAALFLGYPVITMTDLTHEGSREKLLGTDFTAEEVKTFSVEQQVTECYPETFIWYCDSDALVPSDNSRMLIRQLETFGIAYQSEVYEGDAHGWGTGDDTPAAGWLSRAVEFWKKQWNWDHYFEASDGTKIHYLDAGQGKALIFPHGYGGDAEGFREQFKKMSLQFRCIAFDQRGYGESPLTESAGLKQSARDMHELIESLKLDNVVIVGYSMGASVLFAYVEEYGCEYLEKVIIGDMTPKLLNDENWKLGLYQGWYTEADVEMDTSFLCAIETEARSYYFMEQLFLKHTPEEERRYINPLVNPEEYEVWKRNLDAVDGMFIFNEQQVRANRYYMKSMAESDFREVLPRITIPVLLVYAAPGSIYYEAIGRYVESRIPDTRFLLIEDATHMFTPEQNRQYIQAVCEFAG